MTSDDRDISDLAKRIAEGNRRALARGITLVESNLPTHRDQAVALLEQLMPLTGKSIRLGISGVPGVGKSTFIEAFGNHIIAQGHRVAVLAVDPTSALSGGSVLGDKTRMESLARSPHAYIRPSPTGKTLGGVTRRTRESLLLCEAAGFDVILIETVGVGQSETAVADMTDMFLLLLLPGGGDELQGLKRGIMELADLILVNKADGDSRKAAQRTVQDYSRALYYLQARRKNWTPKVQALSALKQQGIAEAWETVCQYRKELSENPVENDELAARRSTQAKAWMWGELADLLFKEIRENHSVNELADSLEKNVVAGSMAPTVAAEKLLAQFLKERRI